MIRKFYRDIAQGRASLKHGVRHLSPSEIAAAETEAARGRALAERHAKAIERIHHPAIKAPEHKCFRVIRKWKGEDFPEDIGYGTEREAMAILQKELAWAQIITPQWKAGLYNWQPMTEKP